jgi:hypothetical protein
VFKVLLRSLPDVRLRLTQAVDAAPRPVIVAQERDADAGGAFERRLPYRHLLEHHAQVSMILVADDPSGGHWRDPVGDLCDRLFRDKRTAAMAATGYVLLLDHERPDSLKRDLWDPWNDVRALVARLKLDIPVPLATKGEQPRARPAAADDDEHTHNDPRPEDTGPLSAPPVHPADPWSELGMAGPGTEDELRKAYKALIVQYHPDKVAHLAAEFRELAERRTRQINEAYDLAQKQLRGEPPT